MNMKTITLMIAAAMTSAAAFAGKVKYTDVYSGSMVTSVVKAAGIDIEKQYDVADIKQLKLPLNNEFIKSDYFTDDFALEYANLVNIISYDFITRRIKKAAFPKTFEYIISKQGKVAKEMCYKYDESVFKVTMLKTADDAIKFLDSGECTPDDIASINESLKNFGVKVVKKYLRANGKTFVAKKDKNGKVLDNPLTAPMKELTDSLNAAKYAGINEWSAKYGSGWSEVKLPWLLSDSEIEALKTDILIDEKDFNKENVVQLRAALGVDGFNKFVKLYNDGEQN